jgi:hypothetical protein
MLSISELLLLKERYSGHKLFYVRFSNVEYVFRDISLKEYRYISTLYYDKYEKEDAICNIACVYPEDHEEFAYNGHAGFVSKAASIIMEQSGVENPLYAMDIYSKLVNINSLEGQCMDLIKAFIGDYSYEEMEDWPYDRLIMMTIKAERIAKLKGFDWHLEDTRDQYKDQYDTANLDNDEFTSSLIEQGIDPMMFFKDGLDKMFKYEQDTAVPDNPVISANKWYDEEMLNAIRRQTYNAKLARQTGQAEKETDKGIRSV